MAHININEIEYIYSTFYTNSFDTQDELAFIKVTFDFAYIKDCKLTISTNEIKEISPEQIEINKINLIDVMLYQQNLEKIQLKRRIR